MVAVTLNSAAAWLQLCREIIQPRLRFAMRCVYLCQICVRLFDWRQSKELRENHNEWSMAPQYVSARLDGQLQLCEVAAANGARDGVSSSDHYALHGGNGKSLSRGVEPMNGALIEKRCACRISGF